MFTSSSRWLILFALRFMCLLVIFVKYLIIIVAIFPPSLTISFSSTSEMLVELKHVFEKNGRSSHGRCSFKKGALENFAKFTVIVFAKCTILDEACNFIKKETLAHGVSCEFCESFKNTFFTEHLRWLLLKVFNRFPNVFIIRTFLTFRFIKDVSLVWI